MSFGSHLHCRLVLQLADALCDLTPAATAVLDRLRGAADLDARLGATYQVAAAGSVLYCCSELAKQLDLADRDAFRLAAASQLVLAAGPLTLRQLKSVAEMQQVQAGGQLSGVSAVLLQQAAQAAMEDMTRVLLQQLCAVAATIGSLLSADRRPQAAAAFASSTARPAVLIPWLRDVTECLRFVRQLDGAEQGERNGASAVLFCEAASICSE